MRRRCRTAALLLLFLAIILAALYALTARYQFSCQGRGTSLFIFNGQSSYGHNPIRTDRTLPLSGFRIDPITGPSRWTYLFPRPRTGATFIGGWRYTILPLWPIPLLPLLTAAYLLLTHRRRHRSGHCPACNYDLTGLPAAAHAPPRCPECGKPVTPPRVTTAQQPPPPTQPPPTSAGRISNPDPPSDTAADT